MALKDTQEKIKKAIASGQSECNIEPEDFAELIHHQDPNYNPPSTLSHIEHGILGLYTCLEIGEHGWCNKGNIVLVNNEQRECFKKQQARHD